MDFKLESNHKQVRDAVREFCEKEVVPFADEWEKEEIFPRDTISKMGELGFFTMPFIRIGLLSEHAEWHLSDDYSIKLY